MRALVTGMSGTGKSSVVTELRRRGFVAYDADDDGFSEPREDGRWGWRLDDVRAWLDRQADQAAHAVFFAGCSEEQALIDWDVQVLLTAPADVLRERLRSRTTNAYGRGGAELARVLDDLRHVEPLLRASADVVVDATLPLAEVVDRILAATTDSG